VNARANPDIKTSRVVTVETPPIDLLGSPATTYRRLTGVDPEAAKIESDESFDRHILACILALAATEKGLAPARSGLTEAEFRALVRRFFPDTRLTPAGEAEAPETIDPDEFETVRDLLRANRSSEGDCGEWLAAMMARRALEPNHLWEDLGLRNRSELTRLIERHFAPLAARNDKNMRWKRFIYRMMCEDDGFVMCSTPICTNCADYHLCYGEESGTSRIVAGGAGSDETSSGEV
jgi:nitrogen fixation protein NifQ